MRRLEPRTAYRSRPPGIPAALLRLTDGRFPSGGHAHSGGLEAAEAREGVGDLTRLRSFLLGRLRTAGLLGAAVAAAAAATAALEDAAMREALVVLDAELDARMPSPVQRRTSRALGRQALRAGWACWPHPVLEAVVASSTGGPHQPLALGAVAAAAGLSPEEAAVASAHEALLGPATAAVRLLGLDPFGTHALVADLGPEVERTAAEAAALAKLPPCDLPAPSAPLLDLSAEAHALWEVRLFAS